VRRVDEPTSRDIGVGCPKGGVQAARSASSSQSPGSSGNSSTSTPSGSSVGSSTTSRPARTFALMANTALRNSAQFTFYTAVRDSVRGLLRDAAATTAAVRTRLDFLGSLVLSISALLVATLARLVDLAG
jgi:hypothetical protein